MTQRAAPSGLTPNQFILLTIEDDTEEAPWIMMGDPQMRVVSSLFVTLSEFMREQCPDWFVASMLPILFRRPGTLHVRGQLGPDLFVARTEYRPRQSYDLMAGEPVPAFVLEVLSPESAARDVELKRGAYSELGVQEYALFAPTANLGEPALQGFLRDEKVGDFVPWELVGERLWSEVLGLWLVARGPELRVQQADGAFLRTYAETRQREKALEAEVDRLRTELQRRTRP
ncbi:MAG: Uma2 family endonuclease [Chloroflexota bacterium]|nr:MAG: hypothetical protein DLM70_18635 [Chloroflexota bacterium]